MKIVLSTSFLLLLSSYSAAETDTFNMTLTGDIEKGYCSLNIIKTTSTNEIVAETIEPSVRSIPIGTSTISISCSHGFKYIAINSTETSRKTPANQYSHLQQTVQVATSNTAAFYGSTAKETFYAFYAPIYEDVDFWYGDNFELTIEATLNINTDIIGDGDNLWLLYAPDNFNHTFSNIITISDTPIYDS